MHVNKHCMLWHQQCIYFSFIDGLKFDDMTMFLSEIERLAVIVARAFIMVSCLVDRLFAWQNLSDGVPALEALAVPCVNRTCLCTGLSLVCNLQTNLPRTPLSAIPQLGVISSTNVTNM